MDSTLSESEIRGDRVGKIAAIIALALVILLLIANLFSYQNPPPGQPGILVNLGFVDTGQGEENAAAPTTPQPDPVPEPTPPAPATPPPPPPAAEPEPKPQQREVVVTEDPAAIALRKQKAREEAERQAERRREQQEVAEQRRREQAEAAERQRQIEAAEDAEAARRAEAEAERRRQAEADALKGQLGGSFGTGSGNGNTGKPGNQGVENGDPNADRLSGISTGSGRVSGGLGGRGVLASPPVRENSQSSGVVVVDVCVNPNGEITKANYTQNGSTTADPSLVAAAIKNARQWRFAANELAPAEQCGRISYNFKVQ